MREEIKGAGEVAVGLHSDSNEKEQIKTWGNARGNDSVDNGVQMVERAMASTHRDSRCDRLMRVVCSSFNCLFD